MNSQKLDKLVAAYRGLITAQTSGVPGSVHRGRSIDSAVFNFRLHIGAGRYDRLPLQRLQEAADAAGVTLRPSESFLKALDRFLERMV